MRVYVLKHEDIGGGYSVVFWSDGSLSITGGGEALSLPAQVAQALRASINAAS